MTWPASDVVTTNLDAATDSPATARSDLLDLTTKFNLLRNHVTAFAQTLLNRASAALARADLGAAASGANTDITSLTPALMPVGVGQAYAVLTGMVLGTAYTNNTGRTIEVVVNCNLTASNQVDLINGASVSMSRAINYSASTLSFELRAFVAPGDTYTLSGAGAASLFRRVLS